ncbi:MAG: exodeoxyribonuclease VII large subunit [Deltaproteobacteria bacterium]|nr:exodeoxyribonuclease VII large subunit [Deltaproteobacteria bacterium]
MQFDAETGEVKEPTPLSVAELDRILRHAVEGATHGAWVQGEIGSLKRAPSGHVYFSLKDEKEDAVIDAVAYRDSAMRARALLSDGARVLVRGKATVWAPRGRLQFVVDAVRPAGRGALLEALEKLKQKLAAEGLFAPERKKKVPTQARTIGVVTSASGAVIHDIIRVAFRRGSARIILSPALVQGEGAAESILAALDKLEKVRGLDVIILGRGGGSNDDLMAFNDERLVRRLAACGVPVISAVGHEVDVSLTDLVADARASTPSQAAEMVVADELAQREALQHLRTRLVRAMRTELVEDRAVLERLAHRLGDPRVLVAERRQRLDDISARMQGAMTAAMHRSRTSLDRLDRRLIARHPRVVIVGAQGRLEALKGRLASSVRARLAGHRATLGDRAGRLEAMSPLSVLARGYAIATLADGRALRDASEARIGEELAIRLRRGRVLTRIEALDNMEDSSSTKGADD